MTLITILYITLALFIALGFSFFQYLYRRKVKTGKDYIFFSLRTLVVFLVLLLLINPGMSSVNYEIEKPDLVLLMDNSESISSLGQGDKLKELARSLAEDTRIQEKFNVNELSFGQQIKVRGSLDHSEKETDIETALSQTAELYSGRHAAIVLITDGNQSVGRDYRYFKVKEELSVVPVILGDTTSYRDLGIERINVNRYAFLQNRFPVEAIINYSGTGKVNTKLTIRSGNTLVYSEEISLSNEKRSHILRIELPATSLGVKTYSLEVGAFSGEKNISNNLQKFAIEVVDERSRVLILADFPHPDLGAIKRSVESNPQRSAEIKYVSEPGVELSNYDLTVLYQVNNNFTPSIAEILKKKFNYLMITGSRTDWNYLNNLDLGFTRNFTNQQQEIFPVYNPSFSAFQFEDIKFDDFPPLVDQFGELQFSENEYTVMLHQEVEGIETNDPLLAVKRSAPKSGFLLGENIWRWRAKSYQDTRSFQKFDDFLGRLVQNLSDNSARQRLNVETKNFYYTNENVLITAQYFDENYQFDPGARLTIDIKNRDSGETVSSDLVLINNYYQLNAGNLESGEYSFLLKVEAKNLQRSGTFEVVPFNVEQQFVSANVEGMQLLAENNDSRLYFPDETTKMVDFLVAGDKFKPVQKSNEKTVPLIDWYYLLFLLISFLALEWFYRKYLGLI